MQITHQIELKPNNKAKTYFVKACGIARFTWNWALAEWKKQYHSSLANTKTKRSQFKKTT